jgi:hypothetical protein
MAMISSHEKASVRKRIAFVEACLRDLHLNDQLSAGAKYSRWLALYGELKLLRQISSSGQFEFRRGQKSPRSLPASA